MSQTLPLTPSVPDGATIAAWFSCGEASAVAAKRTLERFGARCRVRVINNPVAEEDADNRRFLLDVQNWLGVEIEIATNRDYPSCSARDVWEKRRFMAGLVYAPCTDLLKKEARRQWEAVNHHDFLVLGFTAEERDRAERFRLTERDTFLPVLVEEGITKAQCFWMLTEAGIELPRMYKMGYPNANCVGYVKASSPSYWNHVRRVHPEVFADRATQSRELGARLVRVEGRRVFLDELPPNAVGQSMKDMQHECGLFCEEWPPANPAPPAPANPVLAPTPRPTPEKPANGQESPKNATF